MNILWPSAQAIRSAQVWDSARWPNFTPEEVASKGNGEVLLVEDFIDRLQGLRGLAASELQDPRFRIRSWYRDPEHNNKVSKSGFDGPHTKGVAVDIGCHGFLAYWILSNAAKFGFTGIGVKQKGPKASRFIHLDTLGEAYKAPRPTVWSY